MVRNELSFLRVKNIAKRTMSLGIVLAHLVHFKNLVFSLSVPVANFDDSAVLQILLFDLTYLCIVHHFLHNLHHTRSGQVRSGRSCDNTCMRELHENTKIW